MEGGIDADAPLDYAEFHIFPSQNRYEAWVCSGNKVETLASGFLEQLLLHSPEVKVLYSKGSNSNFKMQPPENLNGVEWFSKSTLTRFLHIVSSPDIFNITNTIENEISQLEKTRRFQFSLYPKDHQNHLGSGETGSSNSNGMAPTVKAEVDILSSDASKNELLLAMDLRLTALCGELDGAFKDAAGATCSAKEIADLLKFSHHFGAINIRNSLRKILELSQKSQTVDFPSASKSLFMNDLRNSSVSETERSIQISKPSYSDTPVKYGASPAKAAQVERQCSTESDESSFSSEEDRPSVERSRTPIRSASPRRSASPMRRIQIGRSGSRRAATLTIKSLTHIPSRERVVSHRDAAMNSSEDEGPEQPPKNPENNLQRMSVQDAISLFESKQRDQTEDDQKTTSSLNAFVSANKSVLRRWSSGMGESSAQCHPDIVSESSLSVTPTNLASGELPNSSPEVKLESDFIRGCHSPVETAEVDVKLDSSENRATNPMDMQVDTIVTQREEGSETFTASAEWSRQKEAELNQLLMKMMESKPVGFRNMVPDNSKSKNVPGKQRGGFYNHYKQKRDEKLQGENAGTRAEKHVKFRAMQQFLDEKKAEMASTNAGDVDRRPTVNKPQKSLKNLSPLANPKKETSKSAVVKKAASKASPLPATRKSWPPTPSPRATGTLPAKTPAGTTSAGITPTRRKPQPLSVPRSSPKVERSEPRPKTVKATQNYTNKNIKGVNEKKQQTVTKKEKITGTKVQPSSGRQSSTAKPSFYSKVTKKSSVVPLESKPFLRKGAGIGSSVGPVIKTKVSSQPGDSLGNSGDLIKPEESKVVTDTSDLASRPEERDLEAVEIHANLESETLVISPHKCEDMESSNLVIANADDCFRRMSVPAIETGAEEESIISPTAWVEIEEHQDPSIPCNDSSYQIAAAANVAPVRMSSPCVRHSLSQMLLEESSGPDITEWGNAENPPVMIYEKDTPKGLKRLLKFARKSKADTHLTSWSSPSAFSEGEEDAEEAKASKKNADNLLRKAALHAKNYGQQKTSSREASEKNSSSYELSAQSNLSKFTTRSSRKLPDGQVSASVTTAKATRSFFSLSAFRGSKPNETKLR